MKPFHKAISKIHGRGCFASFPMNKGEKQFVPSFLQPKPNDRSVCIDYNGATWYDLFNPFCFLNHSNRPNAELYWCDKENGFILELIEDVVNGEEITFDYGEGWSDTQSHRVGS